jgi:hypothetical protein
MAMPLALKLCGTKNTFFKKNEAEKLLKTRACGKNEPENEPGHVVENKRWLKIMLRTFKYPRTPLESGPFQRPSSSTNRAACV